VKYKKPPESYPGILILTNTEFVALAEHAKAITFGQETKKLIQGLKQKKLEQWESRRGVNFNFNYQNIKSLIYEK